jgi:hypothetical protein
MAWTVDANKFQNQLGELTTTIALKVQREGLGKVGSRMAVEDVYVLVRQAQRTCGLFFYLNADEHRENPHWRAVYTIVALPLIRSMIDCLYNITAMLADPRNKPAEFRRSGYKMALEALEEDKLKYGNSSDATWAAWLAKWADTLDLARRRDGFSLPEVMAQNRWPTLGIYLRNLPANSPQLTRACAILLCIVTELQAFFLFDGARINARLHEIWNALLPAPEVKDLYDSRYAELMRNKGIAP